MLDQWRVNPMNISSTVIATTLPADHANTLSIQRDPLASQANSSAVMSRMAKRIMAHRHAPLSHKTGCVVFSGSLLSECCNDSATDVTSIAAPMAFCRGVNEHPVSSEKINTAITRNMVFSFETSVLAQGLDGVTGLTNG